jgi:Mrp family chromosome partitioning ATPase
MLSGRKVIIVDADLRRPRIHDALELPNTLGLSDILDARTHAREVIQTVKAMGANPLDDRSVSVITAGLGGAALTETLGGPILKDAIGELTRAYDVVLVDSPPVLAADDALLLAPLVDGVIVVVHTGIVTESDLKLTKARLEGVGGRVLGVVMNRFDPRIHGPGAHPYAARYYEGG